MKTFCAKNCTRVVNITAKTWTPRTDRLTGVKSLAHVPKEEFSSSTILLANDINDGKITNDHEKEITTSIVSPKEGATIDKWWDDEGGALEVNKARKNSSKIFSPVAQKFVEIPYDSWSGCPQKDQNNILRQVSIGFVRISGKKS